MKLNNKEFFKISFLYTAVAAFPPLLNLFVRPLIEGDGKLGPADFSQIEITETIISLAFIIATFAMSNAISRFFYDHNEDKKKLSLLISSVFNSILGRGVLLLLIAYLFRNQIGQLFTQVELQDFSKYGFAAILVGIFRAINTTAFALYRNERKVRRFLTFGFLLGIVRSAFQIIGVFYYDMSFVGYVYGSAIGSGIISLAILLLAYSRSGFHFNLKIMKPVNRFSLPLFEYAFVLWGINFADRYFLESSPEILGIYSQAMILGRGIEIIIQGLQSASQPEMFQMMKEGIRENLSEIKKLTHLIMAQSQLLIALAIIPAMIYCMIFKTELRLAAGLIAIVFVRYILRTQYILLALPIYFNKKTSVFLYLNIVVLVINLALLYFFVPIWKAYGAIAAMLISQTIMVIGLYMLQNRIAHIPWNLNKLLYYPFGIIIFTIIAELVKIRFDLNPFITSSLVVAAIFVSLFLLYKNEIRGILIKIRNRSGTKF
ncbi:MAG: polysaccharide biosynthesis C-terminal domain-containing protein [Bacteroidetes bacterium]|nr:polysaccharide biosynthesis C-terminal domain-containing protein [Bacteroidota bacterium]